ncbi:MAG: DUF4388 domain-containing protein [Myxococcota bacterium]
MNETVLIADSDIQRGRRIAAACQSHAIEANLVAHGAAALEYALSEKPRAMVVELGLPLIDGARLADILQANPHTQGMGILFVGEGEPGEDTTTDSPRMPSHADPETLAHFIGALLEKRKPEPVAAPVEETPGVEGKLNQVSLAELIELFQVNRKTGIVELRKGGGRRAETGRVFLRGGNVVEARTGAVSGEKALYRLLSWRRGSFAFREEGHDEGVGIERPTRAVVREWRRQQREWEREAAELPDPQARVAMKVSRSSLPNVLHPLTQEVLLLLDLSDRVQDVLDGSRFPDYQVLRTLQTLARRGMVEIRAEPARPEAPAGGLFAPALASRLRDWLEQGRSRDAAPLDAKVAVVAAHAEARASFHRALGGLPGVEPAELSSEPGVRPLLRVPVDGDVAIEFFEVPASSDFAAVWPIAQHGALATVFVHGAGLETSLDALREAVEVFGGAPRARSFHLLLDEKDPATVDQLCERVGLLDDRHVVQARDEEGGGTSKALRELLGRLLP